MLHLESEFYAKTSMGLTKCFHSMSISKDYRDVSNVDCAIAYVRKLFGKTYSDQCVTVTIDSEAVGRIFEDYRDGKKGYTLILFEKYSDKKHWVEKLTTVDIKCFYLNCVEVASEKVA